MDDFETQYNDFASRIPEPYRTQLERRRSHGEKHPFPLGLNKQDDVDNINQAMWDAFGPLNLRDGGLLTLRQRHMVISGARDIALACLLFSAEYCDPREACFEILSTLLHLEPSVGKHKSTTPLRTLMDEVATGQHYDYKGAAVQQTPSMLARNSDGLRPYDQVKPDGTRGLSPQQEPALYEWHGYVVQKEYFAKWYPDLNYTLLVKRTLLPLCPEKTRSKVFDVEEAVRNVIFGRTAELHGRYESVLNGTGETEPGDTPGASHECDLLDRLMAEAMFKFLANDRAPNEARQTYLGRLRSHIERMERL